MKKGYHLENEMTGTLNNYRPNTTAPSSTTTTTTTITQQCYHHQLFGL
jgi:hypothetical protein